MKKFKAVLLSCLICSGAFSSSFAHVNDVSYGVQTINKKNVQVVVVNANSRDLKFDVVVANDSPTCTGWENFNNIIKRTKPIAAINGNYFNAYTKNPNEIRPWGYVIKDGKQLNGGATYNKGGFAVMKDGKIIIDNENNIDIENVQTMVHAGPLLVKDSKIAYDPKNSGFTEEKINTQVSLRSAIGLKPDGKVIMVTGVFKMTELADVMLKLGVKEATNLDGGASSALYAKNKYLTPAGRNLNTVLVVYDKPVKK